MSEETISVECTALYDGRTVWGVYLGGIELLFYSLSYEVACAYARGWVSGCANRSAEHCAYARGWVSGCVSRAGHLSD